MVPIRCVLIRQNGIIGNVCRIGHRIDRVSISLRCLSWQLRSKKEVMTEVTTLSKLEEPEIKQEEMKRVEPGSSSSPCIEEFY